MKSIFFLTLITLLGIALPAPLTAADYDHGFICYASNHYRGRQQMIRSGEYLNCSSWRYNSWKTKCAVKLIYYKKNGQKGERILTGDVRDLRSTMRGWKDLKYGSNATWKNVHKAVFFCNDRNDDITKPLPGSNPREINTLLKRGNVVAWTGSNYRSKYHAYKPGKKYYSRSIPATFKSMRLPKGYLVMFTHRTRSGRSKSFECRSDFSDIAQITRTWDVADKRNPWKSIQYFEIRKVSGSKPVASPGKAYLGKEWYNRYKTGYIVFSAQKYYDGDYEAKPNGDYDYRKLGFHPLSIYVPKSNRYVIMEYKAKNGKIKSEVIKKSIDDLDRYLYHLGVHKDYKRTPYKAVKRFAVIRQ